MPPDDSTVMTVLKLVVALVALMTLGGLFMYGANAWVMLALHRRRHRSTPPAPAPPEVWPMVTVQLPLFNERYVAARLLQAIEAFEYPRDRLEIQVLDDSTDDTVEIVAAAVAQVRARGLDIHHLRRAVREGFKAGALADGLTACRGEFVAIFDADFVPPPDFLLRTLPHFAPDVAVVQARWGHLNRNYSILTVAQSLGMDGHFGVEQSARAASGLLLNFNGTAGVWRRAAIVDAGGWQPDTLTEDLDLSYRAQLRGWRIVYRPEIVCPAELPVVIGGFKSQQRRWAKGSIQTARKLLPSVLRAPLPAWTRYQAAIHLTYYAIHPLMLASVLLLLPLRALAFPDLGPDLRLLGMAAFTVGTMGPGVMLAYAQRVLDPPGWRRLWQLPSIMVIGVGVALSTSLAVLEGLVSGRREFVRTPKFGLSGRGGSWRDKGYRQGTPWAGLAELALAAYCATAAWTLWVDGEHAVLPFVVLYVLGFATVGGLTIAQGMAMAHPTTRAWLPGLVAAARRSGRIVMLLLLVALAIPGEARDADPWMALTRQGEVLWARSPEPDNPVACATCHHAADAVRGWAASFPKFRPLPPPHARVMTLLQANAEAVALHYPHADRRAAAVAVSAYLTAVGAGELVTPGRARGQPLLEDRLAALARSRERGERRFLEDCQRCHAPEDLAPRVMAASRFARSESRAVEIFLETHGGLRWRWDGPEVADLVAYLMERNAGRPLEISAR